MKILFLLPVAGQPRYRKRISLLQNAGVEAKVAFFERDYLALPTFPCPAVCVGKMKHGRYLKRLFVLMSALNSVRRNIVGSDVVYAFGFDMALLTLVIEFWSRRTIVYEVADIRTFQVKNGMLGKIARLIDRVICSRSSEIIVTAEGFRRNYFCKRLGVNESNVRVLENKVTLEPTARPVPKPWKLGRPIVIGYFGLLRCPKSWEVLKAIAMRGRGEFKVCVRGKPFGLDVEGDSHVCENLWYGGEYASPADLQAIYSDVDLIWACNSASDEQWLWARTNRFFESCYFGKPVVSTDGGDEGEYVLEHGLGMTVDLADVDAATEAVLKIVPKQLRRWQRAVASAPVSACVYTNEHTELEASLRRILREEGKLGE